VHRIGGVRVDTMVAIEFAVLCTPLGKSKASAIPMRPNKAGKLRELLISKYDRQR
jgi:hypothetical protein